MTCALALDGTYYRIVVCKHNPPHSAKRKFTPEDTKQGLGRTALAVQHIRHVRMSGDNNNNRMERMNGEIRDREKVMRSLKRSDTPILTGYQIYHNYIRPHMALDNKTPAEVAGIEVEGDNKWLTLIQNASRKR